VSFKNRVEVLKFELQRILWDQEHGRNDPEHNHSRADDLLLECIDDVRVPESFDEIDKWYA
jgi:hypothetical protein